MKNAITPDARVAALNPNQVSFWKASVITLKSHVTNAIAKTTNASTTYMTAVITSVIATHHFISYTPRLIILYFRPKKTARQCGNSSPLSHFTMLTRRLTAYLSARYRIHLLLGYQRLWYRLSLNRDALLTQICRFSSFGQLHCDNSIFRIAPISRVHHNGKSTK